MKALLNLKDGKNATIPVLLKIDEDRGHRPPQKMLVNAACTDNYYKGKAFARACF